MILTPTMQAAIVTRANRAPSVHNTQPARWAFADGGVQIYADESRFLDVGDPSLQDAGLSCGAALEGTLMALADHGIGAAYVEDCWNSDAGSAYAGMRLAAKITIGPNPANQKTMPDELSEFVEARFTWRGKFEKTANLDPLLKWGEAQDDINLISNTKSIADLAALNDDASLTFFKNRAYREELVSYMRLSKRHPLWEADGLNRVSMQLSSFEATAANIILRHPMFEVMNKLGLGKAVVSEASKTKSASAIALFTATKAASPTDMGRAFYRRWLEITRLGYAVWPMAVLADDPDTNALCCQIYGIADERRLINVLRIGHVPKGVSVPPARLSNAALILTAESKTAHI